MKALTASGMSHSSLGTSEKFWQRELMQLNLEDVAQRWTGLLEPGSYLLAKKCQLLSDDELIAGRGEYGRP
jgi:hypothetical protein